METIDLCRKAMRRFWVELVTMEGAQLLDERVEMKIKPAFDTACWSFKPPHAIYLGDKILQETPHRKLKCKDDESKLEYLLAFLWHEYAHARFTERNMTQVNQWLALSRLPFSVFNRFEDIRIEHRTRQEMPGFKFNWPLFEEIPLIEESDSRAADAVLFVLTQCEGDEAAAVEHVNDKLLFDEVVEFYRRACRAQDSKELFPIMREWVKRFPLPRGSQGHPGGVNDMQVTLQLSSSPAAQAAFDADTIAADEPKRPVQGSVPEPAPGPEAAKGRVLGNVPHPVDSDEVSSAVSHLKKLKQKRELTINSEIPSKRVSARNVALNRPPYRRKEELTKRAKVITLLVECSGSMSGVHINQARVLCAALSELAKTGAVKGSIILTKDGRWERYKLPMSMRDIELIVADGGRESVQEGLVGNRETISKSDLLIVYTDGMITDAPPDKKMLHKLGVFTWGAYVGAADKEKTLKEHFDKVLVRPDLSSLLRDLLLLL